LEKTVPQKRLCILALAFLLISSLYLAIPTAGAQIVDLDWVDLIETHAQAVDQSTTAEIVVCVFPSLVGHDIKDSSGQEIHDIVQLGVYILNNYPLEVAGGTQTGIGKSGKDNGVLILVALDEREWRIEVGYGLEGDITDIESNLIAQQYLVPAFKQGNYGEGLYDTVVALGEQIPATTEPINSRVRGVYYYESDNEPASTPTSFWDYNIFGIPLWVIVIFLLFGVFIPVFGRGGSGGRWGGGRSGGGGAGGRW
jgi:uncharacterized protein